MKPDSTPKELDSLLDASLNDEVWQASSALIKNQALRTFRTRQSLRRLVRWSVGTAALAALFLSIPHWRHGPALARQQSKPASIQLGHPQTAQTLTDEQLLASFPKGSCFIAEVDGRKQLIFVDSKVEQSHMARTASRDN